MSYGGITFKHVWDFQLRIMMGNQYTKCKEATTQKEIEERHDYISECLNDDEFKNEFSK